MYLLRLSAAAGGDLMDGGTHAGSKVGGTVSDWVGCDSVGGQAAVYEATLDGRHWSADQERRGECS